MTKIDPPKVADNFVAFAKEAAALATTHGIQEFEMTFRPEFKQRCETDPRVVGAMKILFSSADGRGRPCRALAIKLTADLHLQIEAEEPSFS